MTLTSRCLCCPHPVTPEGPGTHLLVDEPQWVLDVWALEGNGRGGTLKHLHEQVVEEPDWGEDHMAQLKQQGQTHKVSGGMRRGLPPALPSNTPAGSHLQASALAVPSGMPSPHHPHPGNPACILEPAGRSYKNQTPETHHCVTESISPEEWGRRKLHN